MAALLDQVLVGADDTNAQLWELKHQTLSLMRDIKHERQLQLLASRWRTRCSVLKSATAVVAAVLLIATLLNLYKRCVTTATNTGV
jgi:hypothetical protein